MPVAVLNACRQLNLSRPARRSRVSGDREVARPAVTWTECRLERNREVTLWMVGTAKWERVKLPRQGHCRANIEARIMSL